MKNVKFEVTLDEAKKIFEALGKMPFVDVYELIGKLNDQANVSLTNGSGKSGDNGFNKVTDQNDFLK